MNNQPNVRAPPGIGGNPFIRSAAAKYARNQKKKKKERQDQIASQAKGEIEDIPKTNSDKAEKKHRRADAWKLLGPLDEKRVENGRTPEIACSLEGVVCAKLGPMFLTLASEGEQYATKKYLRPEMMKIRKETGNQEYAGHLATYQEYYNAYQQEWMRRYH